MQHLDADPQALAGDGQGLAGCIAGAGPGGGCTPAGADPISTAVAGSFSAWEASLEALVAHSQAVRAAGGLAVAHTAAVLEGTDEAGGATIAALAATPVTAPDATLAGTQVPAPPAPPAAPAVPAVPEPISGEAWSAQIHAGAGPAPLAAYASRMRQTSAELAAVAAELRSHAHAIDAHWDDGGIQRAGANVARLADWYDDTAGYARDVATAAEDSAGHVRDAVAGTPRPETFATLQARINDGLQRFARSGGLDVVPLQVATTNMAEAQRTAIDAQVAYAAAANTTTGGVPRPPTPAPPIVGAPSTKGGKNDDAETGDAADEDTEADTEAGTEAGTDEGTEPDADTDADTDTAAGGDDATRAGAAGTDTGAAGDPAPTGPQAAAPPAGDPNALSAPAATTGNTAGQILNGLTQAAGGMSPGMGGGATSPMSALSSLAGLPGSFGGAGGAGMAGTPDMSIPDAHDHSSDDPGLDGGGGEPMDFGAGDTTASGGGDMGASLPSGTTSAFPAAAPASPAIGALPATPPSTPPHSGGPMMGGGMYPPMAGAGAGAQNGERDKALYPDKRVVHREVANTEPVFGELERDRRRPPRQRPTNQEESTHGTTG
ncbi:MAG: hypothetical protein QG655_58 [Actinomycetota bacterium]|jgi:hypothetical protein|nr:hypothetical protein [Actinomycetota bacterium]